MRPAGGLGCVEMPLDRGASREKRLRFGSEQSGAKQGQQRARQNVHREGSETRGAVIAIQGRKATEEPISREDARQSECGEG